MEGSSRGTVTSLFLPAASVATDRDSVEDSGQPGEWLESHDQMSVVAGATDHSVGTVLYCYCTVVRVIGLHISSL